MKDYEQITNCLLCDGKLELVVDFGQTPLANELSIYGDLIEDDMFDLHMMRCINCNHVQLDTIVDSNRLFKDYCYVSSTSQVNRDHFKKYANSVISKFSIDANMSGMIIDIGSNDGLFLSYFHKGINVLGIDPAKNISRIAQNNGIPTISYFFTHELAKKLSSKEIKYTKKNYIGEMFCLPAKIITANHMFGHTKDLLDVIRGVLELLAEDGVFIFENSYLMDMLNKKNWDIQYHEHMHTHSITPLAKLFRRFGMKIFDVERLPNQQGGSIRVFTCRNSDNRKIEPIVFKLLEEEKQVAHKLKTFADDIAKNKTTFLETMKQYHGKKIHCYGYAAKTTTLFYYLGITNNEVSCCYEDAELKQGKYSPGLHIPIVPVEKIIENKPDVLIISAWNFGPSIIEKVKALYNQYNMQYPIFITPLPELKVD